MKYLPHYWVALPAASKVVFLFVRPVFVKLAEIAADLTGVPV